MVLIEHFVHLLEFQDRVSGRSLALVIDVYLDSSGDSTLRESQIRLLSGCLAGWGLGVEGR